MKNSKKNTKLAETLQSLLILITMDTYIHVITLLLSSTPILYPISNALREIFNRSPTLALHRTLPLLLSVETKKNSFQTSFRSPKN